MPGDTQPASARARSPTKPAAEGQEKEGKDKEGKDAKKKEEKKETVSYDVFLAEGLACMRGEFHERGLGLLDKVETAVLMISVLSMPGNHVFKFTYDGSLNK